MPVKQLVPTKSLDKNFKVLDSQLARVGKHVTPGQFCEIQTLAIEGSCGEIDPIKLVELISSRSKGFRGIVSRKTKQLAESHPDVSVEVVAAIAKKHVALFTLQWLQEELKGESLTIENAAGYLGLKEDASDMLGVVGELGKIMRVSGGDVETLKAVVALEAATGGEDLVTLQGIIDAGELYVVRGNEGEITGVMGLIYDNENGIHIHRLGILGDAYGRGVGEKLVKKARERAKRTGRTAIKLTCSSLDAGMTAFYEQHGFQMTGEVKDYYGLKEDLLFLQLGVTEDSPRKSKDGKKLKDEKLPVKLDGFRHNGVYMVQDHKTLQNLQHIEKKSYPKTPEGLNTFAMMADAGGVVVAKDAIFRPEAFCYFFHDKDGETLHLHGVPTKEKGLDVAL
ncbi:MAG: GNAT family N-acetyltransferase, partial [Candidatus Altiarchaeota archaeon]